MPTYAFRFVHTGSNKPTGYIGIAHARTPYDLYWMINEFDDPRTCEIATVSEMAIFVHPTTKVLHVSDALHPKAVGSLPWKKAVWPADVHRKMI